MIKNDMKQYEANYNNNCPKINGLKVVDDYKGSKITLTNGDFKGVYKVINWHKWFDGYGETLETVTVKNVIPFCNQTEIYSTDQGQTFTFEHPHN